MYKPWEDPYDVMGQPPEMENEVVEVGSEAAAPKAAEKAATKAAEKAAQRRPRRSRDHQHRVSAPTPTDTRARHTQHKQRRK